MKARKIRRKRGWQAEAPAPPWQAHDLLVAQALSPANCFSSPVAWPRRGAAYWEGAPENPALALGGSPAGIPGLLLRSERDGLARAGRAAVCVGGARDGAQRGLDYAAVVGRALVRETGVALLAERPGVSPGAEHGTRTPIAGRAAGRGVPGFLLVDAAPRIRRPRGVAGQLDSGQQRDVGGV